MATLYLDNTMVQCFNTCPRRFYWRHIRHIVKDGSTSSALELGRAIHKGLEVFYQTGSQDKAIEAYTDTYPAIGALSDDKRSPENGLIILSNYFKRYTPESWEVLHTEAPGMFELAKDVVFVIRIDLIVKYMGEPYFVEHKTTSNFSWFVPKPNHQISGYYLGCQAHGIPVHGSIVNLIGVFKTKQEYRRVITTRNDEDIEEWRRHTLQTKSRIDECLDSEWFPMYTHSCWNCTYTDLCSSRRSSTEGLITTYYKEEKWEPWKTE